MSPKQDTSEVAADLRARLAQAARALEAGVPHDAIQLTGAGRVRLERAEIAVRYFECGAITADDARRDVDAACDAVDGAVNAARAA